MWNSVFLLTLILSPLSLHIILARCLSVCMHGDDERMAARLMFNFARTKQAAAAATLPGALGSGIEYVFDGTADKIAVEREECVQRMEAHTFLILARATEVWRGRDAPLCMH